jgi:GntR family transcriptional regulator/MocR family aminotransferase
MVCKPILGITLDRAGSNSLQDQIAAGLKQRIQSGELTAGESLPSSRDLARDLGVSRNTIIAVYDRLMGEGYLEARLRSGIFVSRDLMGNSPHRDCALQAARKRSTAMATASELPREPLPFRPSQPDVGLFPLAAWNRFRNRALRRHGPGLMHYQSRFALGLPSLRRALAEYLGDSRGVRCDWQQIAVTNGSQQALYLLSQLLIKSGDRVYLEDPGFLGARVTFERAGAKIRSLRIDRSGVVPLEKPASARLIYTTPSRQFPTGASLPVARRMALLNMARSSKAWLLEDDYDSEFRYTRPPLPSLHSLDPSGHVIYLGSMSKVLYPSLRMGYVVLPQELVEPFEALRLVVEDHGSFFDQATLAAFVASGQFYTHIRRCRKAYAAKLATFLEAARRCRLPLDFPFTDGGMNQTGFFLDRAVDDLAVSQALSSSGIDIPPLSRFGIKKTSPGLVFGFTAFDHRTIQSAMTKVAEIL